jgi:hypothetical protein
MKPDYLEEKGDTPEFGRWYKTDTWFLFSGVRQFIAFIILQGIRTQKSLMTKED